MIRIPPAFIAIWILFFFAAPLSAQQQVRSTTDAGQIEKRIEERQQAPAEPERVTPTVQAPEKAGIAEEPVQPFVLSAVNVTGATVYPVGDFAPLYEEFIGQEIASAEIETIVERITAKYLEDGYFLSSATAPPQDLSFGILSIRVTEGYIERVSYRGAEPGRKAMFDAWAEKITAEMPARLSTVERYILLMNDLPGITATPNLEAEGAAGAYELAIAIAHDRFDAYTSLDNRGTYPVGPLQWSLSGGANSQLGALERIRLSIFTVPDEPRELLYGEVYGQIPVGDQGTHLFASASRSTVDIYSESRASRLQASGDRYSVGGWHPLVRQQELALYLNARTDIADSRQSATDDNYTDRLRVVRLGSRVWFRDGIGGTSSTAVEYSRGFDVFGASPNGYNVSRTDGVSRFDKVTFDVNRVQKITDDFWLELNGAGQHSEYVLLSGEEFAVGGSRFGRGYDPSEISDSRGVAGSIELRHRAPVPDGLLSTLWIYAFYDGGVVWRTDNTKDSLTSAGVGLRMFPIEGMRASLELAKPLTRRVAEEGDTASRVFFSVSYGF